jgi:hypothetical protein
LVAEARDTAEACEDREAQAQHGLFYQLRSHMSTLKSPFNPNDTPSPADVTLDETPRTGLTRHANNVYDNLYINKFVESLDGTSRKGIPQYTSSLYDDLYHIHLNESGADILNEKGTDVPNKRGANISNEKEGELIFRTKGELT